MRKTLIATTMVAMVALTACSSKSDDAASSTSSASTSVSATDSSAPESPSATDASPSAVTPTESSSEAQAPAAAPTSLDEAQLSSQAEVAQQQLSQQLAQMTATFQPVAGQDASQADVDAMRSMLTNIFGQPTLKGVMRATLDNACSDLITESGGQQAAYAELDQIPDTPMGAAAISITNVADAKVNGDEASANVTMSGSGQSQTVPMKFKKENGSWKYCTTQ
ncbi:MAG: hypothetical protein Q3962_02485 [Corynebacterium sp.]|nr:hypothetical protein [Corynebacterium sp.]